MHAGQPVAWCLSDRESSDVIEEFLRSVQAKSPLISVNVMMTDDGMTFYTVLMFKSHFTDNTGWSAARNVFGDIKHLLCRWHVDR